MVQLVEPSQGDVVLFHLVLDQALGNAELLGCMGLNIAALFERPADELLLDLLQSALERSLRRDKAIDVQIPLCFREFDRQILHVDHVP